MVVDVADVFFGEAAGGDAVVHVAVKQIKGEFGVVGGEGRLPVLVALGVEQGDFVGNMHQLGDLLRGKLTQLLHQDFCFGQKVGLGKAADGGGVFFVEVFGWG